MHARSAALELLLHHPLLEPLAAHALLVLHSQCPHAAGWRRFLHCERHLSSERRLQNHADGVPVYRGQLERAPAVGWRQQLHAAGLRDEVRPPRHLWRAGRKPRVLLHAGPLSHVRHGRDVRGRGGTRCLVRWRHHVRHRRNRHRPMPLLCAGWCGVHRRPLFVLDHAQHHEVHRAQGTDPRRGGSACSPLARD
eukprot:6868949-Prymnesium_polylepis.1